MSSTKSKRALVLSGGGARGAYEAGTMRYILEVLPDYLGKRPSFEIICGTSVGAINAAWLAATMDRPDVCVRRMENLWRGLIFSEAVQFSYAELWRNFRHAVLEPRLPLPVREKKSPGREGGFLKTTFFDRVVREEIPFHRISDNLASGLIRAISVSATEIFTGRTMVFAQSVDPLPPWTRDPRRVATMGPLTADKVLASAAIPLLFPAVKIGKQWYSDGGLRHNTPISPALRLGADQLLIISLKRQSVEERINPYLINPPENTAHPNIAFIMGKFLDALLLDPLDYDLDVLERFNAILEQGEVAFGEGNFTEELNKVVQEHRGQGYRIVHPLLIRPSRDIGQLAAEFACTKSSDFWGSYPLRLMGHRALDDEGAKESDLLSFLLFDGGFTGQLLDMGFDDARARHDELVEFFSD